MSKSIVPVNEQVMQLYQRMQFAISECYSLDDCKNIVDKANAIAAYYKQIHDDESVRKFLAIKLRAWRRIGEIFSQVDGSDCESKTGYARKVMTIFKDDPIVSQMSESSVYNSIKLATMPVDFFESQLGEHSSVGSMMSAYSQYVQEEWEASAEGQRELKRRRQAEIEQAEKRKVENAKQQAAAAKANAERAKIDAEHQAKQEKEARALFALKRKRDDAFAEIGISSNGRASEQMHEVIFLLKDSIHAVLRQAASDQRITIQEILRRGLAMWFIANGYDVEIGDMDLRPRSKSKRINYHANTDRL